MVKKGWKTLRRKGFILYVLRRDDFICDKIYAGYFLPNIDGLNQFYE